MILEHSIKQRGIGFDFLRIGLTAFLYFEKMLPIIFPIFTVLGDVDCLYYVFKVLTPSLFENPLLSLLRLFLLINFYLLVARTFAILLVVSLILVKVLVVIIKLIFKFQTSQMTFVKIIKICEVLQHGRIIFAIMNSLLEFLVVLLLGSGIFLSVTVNFGAIKLVGIIPLPIYVIILEFAIVTPFVIITCMSYAIHTYELTNKLLQKLKTIPMNRYARRYLLRKLHSLQPIAFCAGVNGFRLFKVKNSTRFTYFSAIINYTITALLSVSAESVL